MSTTPNRNVPGGARPIKQPHEDSTTYYGNDSQYVTNHNPRPQTHTSKATRLIAVLLPDEIEWLLNVTDWYGRCPACRHLVVFHESAANEAGTELEYACQLTHCSCESDPEPHATAERAVETGAELAQETRNG